MSFEEYVSQHGAALVRLAYVLTGDAHLAQDLAQTALLDAYRNWHRVTAARDPDAYVKRILVNAHLNWRRRRSSKEIPGSGDGEQLRTVGVDPSVGVSDRDHLRRMLGGLPHRARTILVLRYYADLDDQAVAGLLGMSPGGVRAAASRALATLRERNNLIREES